MTLLFEFEKEFPRLVKNFHFSSLYNYGICQGLNQKDGYYNNGFYRELFLNQKKIYSKKLIGEYQRMMLLHFQGPQKILMPQIACNYIDINLIINGIPLSELVEKRIDGLPNTDEMNMLISMQRDTEKLLLRF
jgi:hypothetical protein